MLSVECVGVITNLTHITQPIPLRRYVWGELFARHSVHLLYVIVAAQIYLAPAIHVYAACHMCIGGVDQTHVWAFIVKDILMLLPRKAKDVGHTEISEAPENGKIFGF